MKIVVIYFFISSIIFAPFYSSYSSNSSSYETKSEKIKKLFEIMEMKETIKMSMKSFTEIIKKQQGLKISNDKEKEKIYYQIVNDIVKDIIIEITDNELVDIYIKHFNEKDIDKMIEFYSTKTGKKVIKTTPEITKDLFSIMVKRYIPKMKEAVMEKMKEVSY